MKYTQMNETYEIIEMISSDYHRSIQRYFKLHTDDPIDDPIYFNIFVPVIDIADPNEPNSSAIAAWEFCLTSI